MSTAERSPMTFNMNQLSPQAPADIGEFALTSLEQRLRHESDVAIANHRAYLVGCFGEEAVAELTPRDIEEMYDYFIGSRG